MNDAELPIDWEYTQVSSIASYIRGVTYKKEQSSLIPQEGYLPVLRANNINLELEFDDFVYVDKALIASDQLIKSGDIVFAMSSGSKKHVGKSALAKADFDGGFGAFCGVLRPVTGVNSKFLAYHFTDRAFRHYIEAVSKGTNINNLKQEHLLEYQISVPPINEQHRIVAKIEALFSELDKGIEALKTAREQLKVYRQAVLKHAFEGKLTAQWRAENKGKLESPDQLLARIQQEREARYQQQLKEWKAAVKAWEESGKAGKKPVKPRQSKQEKAEIERPAALPNEWGWLSVGELNTEIFDGPFGSNLKSSDYVDAGVRVIRLENIGYLEFIEEKHSYVTEEKYSSLEKHTVRSGDLIFSSFITEGIRVAVLPESIDRAINKADCFCVRLHGQAMRNDYLAAYLSTRSAYKQVESEIHGIGRPRINTTQLKGFCVPVCGLVEQDEIMAKIEDALSLIEYLESGIDEEVIRTETLRQSILKKAFSGQLVPQDPNDEPAAVLLERILAEKAAQAKGHPGPARGRKKKKTEAA